MYGRNQVDTIQFIRQHLRIAGSTILFGNVVVLALVGKIIYGDLVAISPALFAIVLWLLTVLAASGYGLIRLTMKRAVSSIDEYREKMDMLLYTSRDIHEVESNDMLMDKMVEAMFTITGADIAALLLTKEHGMEFKLTRGPNAEKLTSRTYPVIAGIVEESLRGCEPTKADNLNDDDGYKNIVFQETGVALLSALAIPLVANGRTIGTVVLGSVEPAHFMKDDEELLQFFGNQAIISMKKAEHHSAMADLKQHLTEFLLEAVERMWGKSGHADKVAQYALKIGRTLALDQNTMERLQESALLHDIGLLRCTRAGHDSHPMYGHQLLRHMLAFHDIALVVLHHHERFDGSGYPGKLKGEAIPLLSRIISIAEAFDVMTNPNSFRNAGGRPPLSVPDAIGELQKNAGTQFDPKLVSVFSEVLTQDEVTEQPVQT